MDVQLKRRDFLAMSGTSGLLLAAVLPACGGGNGVAGQPGSAAGAGGYANGGVGSAGAAGEGGMTPTCGRVTAPNIEGPFFLANSPERSNLRESGTAGTLLRVTGRVYSQGCAPLAGALLDFWQADENGAYDSVGSVYRGHQYSDAEGRYTLETIVPGRYLNGSTYRPAHLHVKAAGAGTMLLTSQLYFPDDPYNAGDPFIDPSLIMDVEQDPSGLLVAAFDFVLPAQ
jgi:hypothetical protein